MLAIERLGGAVFANALVERVPPVVAALLHDDGAAGAFQHDHVAHAGASGQRFVHGVLEPHLFAAPPGAVGGDHHLGFEVLYAGLQGLGREPAEHHAVRDAQPRAGQQRHRQLRNHPHIDDGAVAGFEAAALQHVGEAAHQAVQLLVGDLPLVPRLAFPQDGHFVLAMRQQVPVQAVIGDVGLPIHEPFRERRMPFEHVRPLLEPEQFLLGQLAPKLLRLVRGLLVQVAVPLHSFHVRAFREFGAGRIDVWIGHREDLIRTRPRRGLRQGKLKHAPPMGAKGEERFCLPGVTFAKSN